MADATSFATFVKEAREKKKNETLAQHFLGSRGRTSNSSVSANARAAAQKPTLLSRMSGVQKQRSSSARPAANIEGKWQHDLHKVNNPNGPPSKAALTRTASASQIDRNTKTYDRFKKSLNIRVDRLDEQGEINIRGVARTGPFSIIASNFAIGTTAADIEAVVAPHGGELLDCRIVVANPTVMAEITFATKEGADNVIRVFNNKKADGKVLYVYHKEGPSTAPAPSPALAPAPAPARSVPRPSRAYDDMDVEMNGGSRGANYQDGRYGYRDDDNARRDPPRGPRRYY